MKNCERKWKRLSLSSPLPGQPLRPWRLWKTETDSFSIGSQDIFYKFLTFVLSCMTMFVIQAVFSKILISVILSTLRPPLRNWHFVQNFSRKQELPDDKPACKIIKIEDVIPKKPVSTRNFSWDEPTRTSCCKQSPDTLTKSTPSIDLDNHVSTFLKNDVIYYPQFHQPPCSYQAMNQFDIPPFHIPEINPQYPKLNLPGFQKQDVVDLDQSCCYKYEDFTSPVQYTEWDTLYY